MIARKSGTKRVGTAFDPKNMELVSLTGDTFHVGSQKGCLGQTLYVNYMIYEIASLLI